LEPPFLDLHAAEWTARDQYTIRPDARRFETWETNYAGKVGLAVAMDYALDWGLDTIWRRIKALAYQLRTQLAILPGVIVQDQGITQCGIVTFTVDGVEPQTIKKYLASQHINTSVAVRSSTLIDLEARGIETMVRASVHYYNTEDEIDRLCSCVEDLLPA
jgi:cysteine desulfurase/selenocysteine lyase